MKLTKLLLSLFLCFGGTVAVKAETTTISVTVDPFAEFCRRPSSVSRTYQDSSNIPTTQQRIGILGICANTLSFSVEVSSANGGELRTADNNGFKLDYEINGSTAAAVGGGPGRDIYAVGGFLPGFFGTGDMVTTPFTPTTTPTQIYQSPFLPLCGGNGCDIGLQWQITSEDPVPAGTYTYTITYTLNGT